MTLGNLNDGQTAIKVIAAMGALTFVFLIAAATGLKRTLQPGEAQRAPIAEAKSPFNGERAFADLHKVVAFGPRIPGSQEAADLRVFIRKELSLAKLEVWEHAFEASTPIGVRKMVNVVGIVRGTKPGVILVGNHYDTKYFPEFRFVGANDGGSTTAWMIEMARALGPKREGRSVWLLFFDGEEAFGEWSATDSLYGSRAFVRHLRDQKQLGEISVMINVDMIGDCHLGIHKDAGAPAWLTRILWEKAKTLGYGHYFLASSQRVEDDHIPFRNAGVPAALIIDFSYGGSAVDHRKNWHTPHDTMDKVCATSLQAVGDVLYAALPELDAYLDQTGRH